MTQANRSLFVVVSLITGSLATACGPRLSSLHQRAMTGGVHSDAPLHAHLTETIKAPPERVYALLTQFEAWPQWQPNITKVSPPPTVTPGARFTWVNGSAEISSQLALVVPNEALGWTGSVSTAKAIHHWRLSQPAVGQTQVEVEETMDGFLLTVFYSQQELDADMARSVANLKRAAEGGAQ